METTALVSPVSSETGSNSEQTSDHWEVWVLPFLLDHLYAPQNSCNTRVSTQQESINYRLPPQEATLALQLQNLQLRAGHSIIGAPVEYCSVAHTPVGVQSSQVLSVQPCMPKQPQGTITMATE